MKQLTLWAFISNDLANHAWALLDQNAKVVSEGKGNFAALKAAIDKNLPKSTHFLLGEEDFYTRKVEVPKKTSLAKLKLMLPYLLEEEVLEDIETVGFFPLKQSGETADVMIYDKAKLLNLFESFKSHQLKPDWVGLVGFEMPDWSVYQSTHLAHVKLPHLAFSSMIPSAWDMIQLYYDQIKEKPEKIQIVGQKGDFEGKPSFTLEEKPKSWLFSYFAKKLKRSYNLLDLTQREVPVKTSLPLIWHAGIMATLFLGLVFGLKTYDYFTLQKMEKTLQAQIDSIYFKLYPQSKSVVAPRTRMEQELSSSKKGGGQDFIYLLSHLGQSLKQYPQMTIHSIQYRDNRLDIDLIGKDYQGFDAVVKDLSKKPIKVSQKNTTKQGEEVRTSLHLERGAL